MDDGLYVPIDVKVFNLENHGITARTYQMTSDPPKVRPEVLPLERRPSNTYLQVYISIKYKQIKVPKKEILIGF